MAAIVSRIQSQEIRMSKIRQFISLLHTKAIRSLSYQVYLNEFMVTLKKTKKPEAKTSIPIPRPSSSKVKPHESVGSFEMQMISYDKSREESKNGNGLSVKEDFKKTCQKEGAIDSCCICVDDFSNLEEVLCLTECNHLFHKECLDSWIETKLKGLRERTQNPDCPSCRA
mmetsp:Transcript_7705/g.12926  ORF Transcript_7705/g.12926 Transcript_7705/m.12926 type:complete len:170 (-) Transcript_7705:82-591(-)|eukprot:CAMPEP_0168607938 /NCGR_PEP_ID=MMETSP0449_2-20121227/349_1 /TAXON_ID=1082188 /ORGANISM="Strombidium rassoulzadegani, Strain ras09" /LENGTH=169 /DNA_ID=CAMNT_0008647867 /DNA_START=62 /DNA_END=571 /DNA_ORIENTATION=-